MLDFALDHGGLHCPSGAVHHVLGRAVVVYKRIGNSLMVCLEEC